MQEKNSEDHAAVPAVGIPLARLDENHAGAELSPCGRYRYSLWRSWGAGGAVAFVGLNPSTADATTDDATIRRCVGFARDWGYGALVMVNLFAWRATNPRDMMAAADPVGPGNDDALRAASASAAFLVAAWGAHGSYLGRDARVRAMLPELHALGFTKAGQPKHPLYLPRTMLPTRWTDDARHREMICDV